MNQWINFKSSIVNVDKRITHRTSSDVPVIICSIVIYNFYQTLVSIG